MSCRILALQARGRASEDVSIKVVWSRLWTASLCLFLLFLYSLPARSQTTTYYWQYPGQRHVADSGCAINAYNNEVCATAYATCQSVADGGSLVGLVNDPPYLKCYTSYTDDNGVTTVEVSDINPNCPAGLVYDFNTPVGCAPSLGAQPNKAIGSPCGTAQCSVGEPISVGTGNVFVEISDYDTAGENKLGFHRYYNSRASYFGTLAANWRGSFDRFIRQADSSTLVAERADGQIIQFTLNAGIWTTDSDLDMSITDSGGLWKLVDKDGNIEQYDDSGTKSGYLNSIQKRNGYIQTLSYNSSNQLTHVVDSYGRQLTFSYNGQLLQTLTTPESSVSYSFEASTSSGGNDRLKTVSYSTSPVTTQVFTYSSGANNAYALTSITDENGVVHESWTYDSYGRGLTSKVGTGSNADTTTISYNDSDGSRNVTNGLGQQEVYKFTTLQGTPKITEIDRKATSTTAAATKLFTYDANGYSASVTDWNGHRTEYTNNAYGHPTQIKEAADTASPRTTNITYGNTYHNVVVTVSTSGQFVSTSHDGSGNLTSSTATDYTSQSVPYSTNGQTRTTIYTWSPTGQLLSVQKPRTDVTAKTQYTYGTDGALLTITDAANHVTQITSHTGGGLPLTMVDANGVTTTLGYDARQRLTSSSIMVGGTARTTAYSYDAVGNLLTTMMPDGSTFTNAYDDAHRPISKTDYDGDVIAYTLDPMGNQTQAITKNASGTTTRQHASTFDALGRLLTDKDGMNDTTTYAYDANGNATTITDPASHAITQAFDAFNRRTSVTDRGTGITATSYDAHDRPLTVTAPNGAVTSYVYDGFGEMIQETSADRGTTVYQYDADGNLTQKTDATGAVTNWTYDALDRPLARSYPADSTLNVTFTYDQSGHGEGIGRLTSLTDASGSLSRSYDERGNVTSESRTSGTHTLTTAYSYDANGSPSGMTYPSGLVLAYTRDHEMRLKTIQVKPSGASSFSNLITNAAYQPFGPLGTMTLASGITETPTYDLDYRMTQLVTAGSASLLNLTYGYNANSDPTTITDNLNSTNTQTLGYDAMDRLNSASSGYYGPISWTYDLNGNRTQQNGSGIITTYNFTANTNRLASIINNGTTQSAVYNAAGNLSTVPSNVLNATATYNKANQMASMVTGSTSTTYGYDAFGQRIIKNRSGSNALYLTYDSQGHTLEENDFSGTLTDYIYLNDKPVALVQGSNIYYLHTDRLGTPQLATNSSQATVWTGIFRPFGTAYGLSGSLTGQNLRFPGQTLDLESLLQHNGLRNYLPQLGRYLESDPIGLDAGTANTYAYASNSPLVYTDPRGLDALGGVAGIFFGAYGGFIASAAQNASGSTMAINMFAGAVTGGITGTLSGLSPTSAAIMITAGDAAAQYASTGTIQLGEVTGTAISSYFATTIAGRLYADFLASGLVGNVAAMITAQTIAMIASGAGGEAGSEADKLMMMNNKPSSGNEGSNPGDAHMCPTVHVFANGTSYVGQ